MIMRLACILILATTSASAQLARNIPEFAAIANQPFTNLFATVAPKMSQRLVSDPSTYTQAIRSHNTLPRDGTNRTALATNVAPTRGASWATLAAITNDLPFAARLDVYDGPQGKGWCLVAEALLGTNTLRRTRNVGPEIWRSHPWQ